MANISILGQVSGSAGLAAAAGHHLIKRTAAGKLGVEFAAKLALAAGSSVETSNHCRINVFHEEKLLRRGETASPGCEAKLQSSPR